MNLALGFDVGDVVGDQLLDLARVFAVPPDGRMVVIEAPGPRHALHQGVAGFVLEETRADRFRGVVQAHGKPGARRRRHRAVEPFYGERGPAKPRRADVVPDRPLEGGVPGVDLGAVGDSVEKLCSDRATDGWELDRVQLSNSITSRRVVIECEPRQDRHRVWVLRPHVRADVTSGRARPPVRSRETRPWSSQKRLQLRDPHVVLVEQLGNDDDVGDGSILGRRWTHKPRASARASPSSAASLRERVSLQCVNRWHACAGWSMAPTNSDRGERPDHAARFA